MPTTAETSVQTVGIGPQSLSILACDIAELIGRRSLGRRRGHPAACAATAVPAHDVAAETSPLMGSSHMLHNAWVGDIRAARIAGISPASAPMSTAAPMPPPHASAGTTIAQPLVDA